MPTVEEQLIANILTGDDASRAVYADWLDQHGRPQHAEFLRLQGRAAKATSTDAAFVAVAARLRELAPQIDVQWRMQIARPIVEECKVGFQLPCPADWGAMTPTARPDVRTCSACNKEVRYCMSEEDAQFAAYQGACVVVDASALRWERARCRMCNRATPKHFKFCLECGTDLAAPPVPSRPLAGAPLPVRPLPQPEREPVAQRDPSPGPARACRGCLTENPSTSRYCHACGMAL